MTPIGPLPPPVTRRAELVKRLAELEEEIAATDLALRGDPAAEGKALAVLEAKLQLFSIERRRLLDLIHD